jgi:hypothetical protein
METVTTKLSNGRNPSQVHAVYVANAVSTGETSLPEIECEPMSPALCEGDVKRSGSGRKVHLAGCMKKGEWPATKARAS